MQLRGQHINKNEINGKDIHDSVCYLVHIIRLLKIWIVYNLDVMKFNDRNEAKIYLWSIQKSGVKTSVRNLN